MSRGIPLFVVEGHLEHKFLEETCGGKVRVLKLSNGKTVSPQALAKQALAQIAAASKEPAFVIVIADREKRCQSSSELEAEVARYIRDAGLKIPCSVHVPDMMIENWILADSGAVEGAGLQIEHKASYEGCHGKGELDLAFKKKSKHAYKEVIDGVKLLKTCSAKAVAAKSVSFSRFAEAVAAYGLQCHWMKR